MMKPWRLTRRAEESLIEIAEWTYATFGPRQAEAYEADLIARCEAIACGEAASRDCSILVGAAPNTGLRYARAGQHFVVFLEDAEQILIVEILHGRSDLPRHLAALTVVRGG